MEQSNQNELDLKTTTSGLAISSMILGILSVLTFYVFGFGILLGILSIIFAYVSRRYTGGRLSGMAIAGITCSICGIIMGVIFASFFVIGLTVFFRNDGMSQYHQWFNSWYR